MVFAFLLLLIPSVYRLPCAHDSLMLIGMTSDLHIFVWVLSIYLLRLLAVTESCLWGIRVQVSPAVDRPIWSIVFFLGV